MIPTLRIRVLLLVTAVTLVLILADLWRRQDHPPLLWYRPASGQYRVPSDGILLDNVPKPSLRGERVSFRLVVPSWVLHVPRANATQNTDNLRKDLRYITVLPHAGWREFARPSFTRLVAADQVIPVRRPPRPQTTRL
jgi:hypothetical protein